ncbi:MAG: hypothetical protein Q9162_007981, partial [Coniocarpon cinnabarinum]
MPKAARKAIDPDRPRHNPLAEDYSPTAPHQKHKSPKRRKLSSEDKQNENEYVDTKASQRILRIGQDLIEEDKSQLEAAKPNPAFDVTSRGVVDGPEQDRGENGAEDDARFPDDTSSWGSGDEIEGVELDPADQDIFNRFHPANSSLDPSSISLDALNDAPANPLTSKSSLEGDNDEEEGEPTNLTALILSKIAEHEAGQPTPSTHLTEPPLEQQEDLNPLPPAAVQVYTRIGQLLSAYRSGALPKPFKILPSLPSFQLSRLLDLTNPQSWSPHAHLASVRLFISSKPEVATPYLRHILLPKVRDDIRQTRKLNVHLYAALKKSLYKPAAFFKGVLFPLLEGEDDDGPCNLREAQILSSVLARVKVPVLHSAAALLRCCDIAAEHFSLHPSPSGEHGSSPTNLFIKTLLEKKYALPYKVIDALVFHFCRFKALKNAAKGVEGGYVRLPVLWHQGLLAFAQR